MISVTSTGKFDKTLAFLNYMKQGEMYRDLDAAGRKGVAALSAATPKESGETAASWDYSVEVSRRRATITWHNTNVNDGANIAILLQYGHGTGTGGYVAGYDYINPAMRPVFDQIAEDVWRRVTNG